MEVTSNWLKPFWWPNIGRDVSTSVRQCLHCGRTTGGNVVPRPLMYTLYGQRPNDLLHFDFMHIRTPKEHQYKAVLVIVDDFSKFLELVPVARQDADAAVTALMAWFSRYGIALRWSSDGGSHFVNTVVAELRNRMGCTHNITVAYAPWANGKVEVQNRELRRAMNAIMSAAKMDADDWPYILPVGMKVLNESPKRGLAGLAPCQVFQGRQSSSPMDTVFLPHKERPFRKVSPEQIRELTEDFMKSLDQMHRLVSSQPRRTDASPTRPGQTPVDFSLHDFVLVARLDRERRDKTMTRWYGPALVTRVVNELVYEVEDLNTKDKRIVHAVRLKPYADSQLHVSTELLDFVAHNNRGYPMENIIGHRDDDGAWELLVQWQHETPDKATWEPLDRLYDDAPRMVRSYVQSLRQVDHALRQFFQTAFPSR